MLGSTVLKTAAVVPGRLQLLQGCARVLKGPAGAAVPRAAWQVLLLRPGGWDAGVSLKNKCGQSALVAWGGEGNSHWVAAGG
jgi:hypothetical protein